VGGCWLYPALGADVFIDTITIHHQASSSYYYRCHYRKVCMPTAKTTCQINQSHLSTNPRHHSMSTSKAPDNVPIDPRSATTQEPLIPPSISAPSTLHPPSGSSIAETIDSVQASSYLSDHWPQKLCPHCQTHTGRVNQPAQPNVRCESCNQVFSWSDASAAGEPRVPIGYNASD
jgi:hypothetical protein